MKAYKAWDNSSIESYSTIVFAENSREAKKVAFTCDVCEDADYIQVRVKRLPEADKLYKGKPEIDWWDEETRLTLVKEFFWTCDDISYECDACVAKEYCEKWGAGSLPLWLHCPPAAAEGWEQ